MNDKFASYITLQIKVTITDATIRRNYLVLKLFSVERY